LIADRKDISAGFAPRDEQIRLLRMLPTLQLRSQVLVLMLVAQETDCRHFRQLPW